MHNGSGKPTTIRLIDSSTEAESGEIFISTDPRKCLEKRRPYRMVFFKSDNYLEQLWEDDGFGFENQGMDHETMVNRVNEALEIVGMQDFKNRENQLVFQEGKKQRVAIAE